MNEQRHRIGQQILEVTIPDAGAAWALQDELSRIQARRLESIIDRCCTEASAPDRLHRIDSLEVDLGVIDLDHLEDELGAKLEEALQKALERRIREEDERIARRGEDPEVTARIELLDTFVQTGTLPWWADATRPRVFEEALAFLMARDASALVAWVRALGRAREALPRLVRHASDAQLAALCKALFPVRGRALEDIVAELVALLESRREIAGMTAERFRVSLWTALLGLAITADGGAPAPVVSWREFLVRAARTAGVTYPAFVIGLDTLVPPGETTLGAVIGQLARAARAEALADDAAIAEEMRHEDNATTGASGALLRAGREAESGELRGEMCAATAARAAAVEGTPIFEATSREPEELYVENAGLVVLWPFLGHFFGRLGLMEDNRFLTVGAQHRAVGLLQHLATGERARAEYQLPLAKVLCGVPLEEPLDFGPEVSDAEAEESVNLLSAVVAHAPILRDMSIEGLRGSFLIRKGVLSVRDEAWLLQVERVTYDVVLDRFPWSVGCVRLPWMEGVVWVEW